MLCVSLPGLANQQMMKAAAVNAASTAMASLGIFGRYDFDGGGGGCWIGNEKGKRNQLTATTTAKAPKKRRLSISPLASSALADIQNSSRANFYEEVLKAAREKFTQEISFQSKDKDISLAKALLYVAAEDEAFMAFNREMDAQSLQNERRETSPQYDVQDWDCVEALPLGGKSMNQWLAELDAIAKEVEAELVEREIGCNLVEVLESVNMVLFKSRGFNRSPVLIDSKCAYLHSVLSSGCCSAILLSVIYIEVCRRLNLTIVGSRVGEDFLIWPPTGNPEELFRVTSGHSLFGVVNGKCVNDPRSKASDINSSSLSGLEIATNRDIIGIALANLIRLYWKRASRTSHGLMLTSPLRPAENTDEKFNKSDSSNLPLLRPQDLRFELEFFSLDFFKKDLHVALGSCDKCYCFSFSLPYLEPPDHSDLKYDAQLNVLLGVSIYTMPPCIEDTHHFPLFMIVVVHEELLAIMASQRLLILQPHNWALRRDYGMMLYYSREYEEAVQELSICMVFAPEEELEVLEPFVEKLHLLRLESSWKSLGHKGRLTVT